MCNNKMKNIYVSAGVLSITAGSVALIGFMLLKKFFGYPEIIRETPDVLLTKLYETRYIVPYLYYIGIGGAGICIFFFSLLLRKIFQDAGEDFLSYLGTSCGMIVGLCLFAGIIRYTFLFPMLSEFRFEGKYSPEVIDLVFEAFNTYIGDSIAEHVQFTFMFFWIFFSSIAMLKTKTMKKWIAYAGIFLSVVIFYGNLEFFNVPGAFMANRLGADLVALWIILLGINLICKRNVHQRYQDVLKQQSL